MRLADVGNTPLVELEGLLSHGNRLFVKCEYLNPSGSHKDRTYLHMITALEKAGVIRSGMMLIDCSTGNGGAALAWIGREKGYYVKVFMPEGMTEERKQQIRSYGADIVETPKECFLMGAVRAAQDYERKCADKNIFFLDQSNTLLNKFAWHSCGEEICKDLSGMNVEPDFFICSIGTGGTCCGIAEVLKRRYRNIKTIGIEVSGSAPLYAARQGVAFEHHAHNLMGMGAGVLSVNTVSELIDEVMVVDGDLAWSRMKKIIAEFDYGIGPTCGANVALCEEVALQYSGKKFVTLFFDCAWKYKSRWSGIYPEYTSGD